jgi:hypothetical protein
MRKEDLHALGFNEARGMISHVLDMHVREEEIALVRGTQRQLGALLVESWLDDVLARRLVGDITVLKDSGESRKRALTAFGVSREDLANAGLSEDQIDRLHRAFFTYSVGFSDMLRVHPYIYALLSKLSS